jgi:two-component sensor histidine kinase
MLPTTSLDFRNTESLGLQLVAAPVEQLEGTVELDRGSGTTFKITFAGPEHGGMRE